MHSKCYTALLLLLVLVRLLLAGLLFRVCLSFDSRLFSAALFRHCFTRFNRRCNRLLSVALFYLTRFIRSFVLYCMLPSGFSLLCRCFMQFLCYAYVLISFYLFRRAGSTSWSIPFVLSFAFDRRRRRRRRRL